MSEPPEQRDHPVPIPPKPGPPPGPKSGPPLQPTPPVARPVTRPQSPQGERLGIPRVKSVSFVVWGYNSNGDGDEVYLFYRQPTRAALESPQWRDSADQVYYREARNRTATSAEIKNLGSDVIVRLCNHINSINNLWWNLACQYCYEVFEHSEGCPETYRNGWRERTDAERDWDYGYYEGQSGTRHPTRGQPLHPAYKLGYFMGELTRRPDRKGFDQ